MGGRETEPESVGGGGGSVRRQSGLLDGQTNQSEAARQCRDTSSRPESQSASGELSQHNCLSQCPGLINLDIPGRLKWALKAWKG